jgi:transcriptional regulator with XRE-family HTH domain
MPRDNEPTPSDAEDLTNLETNPSAIAKWRRLTPDARNVLGRVTGREPLATNLRKARENRGLSQATVAKNLRLSRSLVAQIELANRPVTADELAKFADLYGTSAVELAGTPDATGDIVRGALLNLAPALVGEFDIQSRIRGVLGSLMEAMRLERLLERPLRTGPPTYPLPSPRTLVDAIRQGEEIAAHERQRLGLRDAPLPELSDLCAAQGVPVFALKLPDEFSGVFIADASAGFAIVVNLTHDAVRHRLAIAHGYAHAVCEPMGTIRVSTHANGKELIERRAAAFATAFLLPAAGVAGTVHRLGKGQPSRQEYWAFDAASEQSIRAEERSTPGSQTMTYLDGVWIARRFGTTYSLAIARLLGLGLIAASDRRRLLRPAAVALAQACLALLGASARQWLSASSNTVAALSDLPAERLYMAVEAYRRGLMTKADLVDEAVSLSPQLPGLSEPRLLELAEAAR